MARRSPMDYLRMTMQKDPSEVEPTDAAAPNTNAADAEAAPALSPEEARIQSLEAELGEMKNRYLRSVADMDNVRRRAKSEAADARKFANEVLVTDLLPVLDNFTRAMDAAEQSENLEALKSGVEQIHRQLHDILTRAGLERIECLGEKFDPNLHEAIMQVEPEGDQEPHQVVEELRAGYRLADRVIRPSLVKVTSG